MTNTPITSITDELLAEIEAAASKPMAYARDWKIAGIAPYKERNENGRIAWPKRFILHPVTEHRVLKSDSALYAVDAGGVLALTTELRRLRAENEALTLKAEYASNNHMASLMLVADIRAAAGDPDGRLMQTELVAHIEALQVDAGRYRWLRDKCHLFDHYRAMKHGPDAFELEIDTAMQSNTEGN